jgi:hypothetical protein
MLGLEEANGIVFQQDAQVLGTLEVPLILSNLSANGTPMTPPPAPSNRHASPHLYPLSTTATLAKSLRTNRVLQVGLKPVAVTVTEWLPGIFVRA